MKTLILIAVCLFTLNTTAQSSDVIAMQPNSILDTETHTRKEVTTIPSINAEYLNTNEDVFAAAIIKKLQQIVASYNITEDSVFDENNNGFYSVSFTSPQGYVLADFDSSGEILSSSENYKDLALPTNIRMKVANENPGWMIASTHCKIFYNKGQGTKTEYKIKLSKNKLKKTLKVDEFGNQL